jgi:hypothetical protein
LFGFQAKTAPSAGVVIFTVGGIPQFGRVGEICGVAPFMSTIRASLAEGPPPAMSSLASRAPFATRELRIPRCWVGASA